EQIRDAFSEFFEGSLATPTDPNELYTLQRRIEQGHIIDPDEMSAAVAALLSGEDRQQAAVYGNLTPAVRRFTEAPEQIQDEFREAVTAYVRAYAFLAQVMSWTDPELEELFLYCKALALELPTPEGEPLPLVSTKVQLTHLRIAVTLDEADVSLIEGSDEATDVFPGGGAGRQNETPMDRLSALIATMNERFGMDLGEPDKLYLEQQKAAVLEDDDLRVIAMHNDRDQFEEALAPKATDLIVERHQSNQVLFDAFFANPAFQKVLIEYLATTYDDFRSDTA
ncbi:MAG: type I restriction endonuclease subunit R, partial [Actinomycetia bacterium]|nr:type I restriction endonuclease subunit R [Actinomycetes bacterium]